jgi:hypothetical protein
VQILNRKLRPGPAQSAADKQGDHRKIANTQHIVAIGFLQQESSLMPDQPVSGAGSKLLCLQSPAPPRLKASPSLKSRQPFRLILSWKLVSLDFKSGPNL